MDKITYGFYKTQFGEVVLGKTSLGLCWLGFMVNGYKGDGFSRMKMHFPNSEFIHDDNAVNYLGDLALKAWNAGELGNMLLDLRGSAFQKSVWHALLNIKKGEVKSYGDIASAIGKPKSTRAVGGAVGSNPISLIVPCHRVLQKSGAIGNYGWGVDLKRKILLAEGLKI